MEFTREQKEVIAVRGSNLLVSAAAGSGKTAVLVERIIEKVIDEKNPVDIDRILVMTFTRAAAAQLKSRLSKKIMEMENEAYLSHNTALRERLRRQSTLIRSAFICTIDSFCTYVLRNNFEKIGLDPAFKMANDADLKLLRDEVMKNLLEEEYENGSESFYDFLDNYSLKKNDKDVEDAILQLYDFSQSAPYPIEWLESCKELYSAKTAEELLNNRLLINYFDRGRSVILEVAQEAARALELASEPDGPYSYIDILQNEVEAFNKVAEIAIKGDYSAIYEAVRSIDYARLPACKDDTVNQDKKIQVQEIRKNYKGRFDKLQSTYFSDEIDKMFTDVNQSKASVDELIRLAVLFSHKYLEAKLKKRLVDFSDLEHMTLDVLYDTDEKGERVPSAPAEALRELFDEIMVDEYQDSNYVQEKIVEAISRKENGNRNVFLVGDVKQSIYRFRLAKPELFVEKRDTYTLNDVENKGILTDEPVKDMRIDLHRNFRSRQEVVDTVNAIFEQIMIKEVGGVEYDKDARLTCAADYITGASDQPDNNSELIIVCDDGELGAHELEAQAVADRILKLCKEHKVQDGDGFRPVRFSDIAILLRSSDKWDKVFKKILESKGIPAVIESKTGYFDSFEINSIITYITVINNPRNDEKLCEALIGPFGGITNEQLAMVRIAYPEVKYYEALMRYANVFVDDKITDGEIEIKPRFNTDEVLKNKDLQEILQEFFSKIKHYRKLSSYLPINELISQIMMDFHYEKLIGAMPMGQERLLNITMLLDKASEYEKSSYKGLFHFVQYIERIRKLEVDSGSAQLQSENDNVVRIMTIHKSKGLEFPICIVAGMGKKHNTKDTTKSLLTDSDYGIGIEYIDSVLRYKYPTVVKKAIANKMMVDSLGEELRVLYVALTRAKEKLIMTGTVDASFITKKGFGSWDKIKNRNEVALPENLIMSGGTYLEWVMMALCRSISSRPLMEMLGIEQNILNPNYTNRVPIDISLVTAEDLTINEIDKQGKNLKMKQHFMELYNSAATNSSNEDYHNAFNESFNWEYPYTKVYVPTKVSVSYIKHQAMEDNIADRTIFEKSEKEEPVPEFIKGKEAVQTIGSLRGTAYHRVFELIDYSRDLSEDGISQQIDDFVNRKLLDVSQAKAVSVKDIAAFAQSDIGRRMKIAFDKGLLKREQPFCIMRPANEVSSELPDSEEILIQGIIDVCFVENDEFVIVDYKTDKARDINELVLKYKAQLDYYAIAIEQITKKRVAEKIIYSVTLNDEISV